MSQLRAAVIGLGVGEQHIAGYRAHPACQVVALADTDPAKLAEVGARHPGLRLTASPDELLTDPEIDLVSIASYDDAHAAQLCTALRHGKHVFVEKPLCLFPSEARDIRRELAAHPGLLLSSNLILRRCPRFVRLKQLIDGGELGAVYYIEGSYDYGRLHKIAEGWRGRLDYYSVFHGGGVHLVDLFQWLLGVPVEQVTAFGNRLCSEGTSFRFDDLTAALLRYRGGTVGKIAANFGCVHPHFHALAVYGTKGTFIHRPEHGLLYRSRDPQVAPEPIDDPYPGYHKGQFLHNFVEAILTGGQPAVTADEVFSSMSICFAVEQAARDRAVIDVEYL